MNELQEIAEALLAGEPIAAATDADLGCPRPTDTGGWTISLSRDGEYFGCVFEREQDGVLYAMLLEDACTPDDTAKYLRRAAYSFWDYDRRRDALPVLVAQTDGG